MLTEFGKYLRRLRLDCNQLMKEMAGQLNVTPAYLSAIENGKRKPTKDLVNKIQKCYSLSNDDSQQLKEAYAKTINEITIDMSNANTDQSNLGLIFARKIDSLSDDQILHIKNLLLKGENK